MYYPLGVRSNEIFSQMSPEQALSFLEELREEAPDVARIALSAASQAFKLRPQFLKKQPRARQAEWVRRALARVIMAPAAEEVLAEFFLEYRSDLLAELLDALGVEHEQGRLTSDTPSALRLRNWKRRWRSSAAVRTASCVSSCCAPSLPRTRLSGPS